MCDEFVPDVTTRSTAGPFAPFRRRRYTRTWTSPAAPSRPAVAEPVVSAVVVFWPAVHLGTAIVRRASLPSIRAHIDAVGNVHPGAAIVCR
jgi:hypothetical protein